MAFELLCSDNNIDRSEVTVNGISSIETIHNVSKKVFDNNARLIAQFTKSQNIGNNYLYVDIVMKMKSGANYLSKL